jgi:hypothetical protein
MEEQTIYLPPRTTAFRAVCEACQDAQLPSRGYVGAIVEGVLRIDESHGYLMCTRGHPIRLVRATPETAFR